MYNPERMTTEELENVNREIQSVPDFIRGLHTGELHYMPLERVRSSNVDSITNTPAAFLPSTILEMLFKVQKVRDNALMPCLSMLCWFPEEEVKEYFETYQRK